MKIPGYVSTTLVLIAAFVSCPAADLPRIAWSLTEGIETPESACYDAVTDTVYLSQIGQGGPTGDDGDGWISKLTPEGKVIANKWITGLSAPKGIRVHDGMLWVSDITRLVAVDISAGKIVKKIEIAGAKFLNDVAVAPDGTVYVSDMIGEFIHAHKNGKTRVFAKGKAIEHPNGLLVHNGKLYVGGWGRNLQDDFSTNPPGRLLAIDLKTKQRVAITKQPLGNLDGVELDGKGGFIVTDWMAGKIFQISSKGVSRLLFTLPPGTADHAYIPERRLLILPRMTDNAVTAYDLSSFLN
jgi:hypothetical protein